jgi:predicted nucleic acid-binding protein
LSGILFDTSVYIAALRQGDASILGLRRTSRTGDRQTRPLWLSVVVLEELYVGAVDAKVRRDLQRMEREFDKIGRLLVPGRRDWTTAGTVLSKVGQKYGFNLVGKARLTNDAVIAMSVASHGFTIQTKDPGDFQLIAEFRPFDWETV